MVDNHGKDGWSPMKIQSLTNISWISSTCFSVSFFKAFAKGEYVNLVCKFVSFYCLAAIRR